MRSWNPVLVSITVLVSAATALGQNAVEIPLESLFEWNDPMALDAEKLSSVLDPAEQKIGRRIQEQPSHSRVTSGCVIRGGDQSFKITAFNGKYALRSVMFHFAPAEYRSISLVINCADYGPSLEKDIEAELGRLTGDSLPTRTHKDVRNGSDGTTKQMLFTNWLHPKYSVETFGDARSLQIYIRPRRPGDGGSPADTSSATREVRLSADLDSLLNFSVLWRWSSEDFEKNYVLKLEDQKQQQKPPQFEWVSSTKERARFSRHMFSNAETNLTMFGGSIKVEEAILEFVNGKAARATISFYNRGDSGDIEVAEFDRMFKTIGQNLGQVTKVAPKRQIMSANAALPVTSWM